MPPTPASAPRRPLRVLALLPLVALTVAACGGDDDDEAATADGDTALAETDWEARCAANEEAGTVTFLTGFQYAASPSIIGALVAEDQGYFDEMCLDVEIRPANSGENIPLLASGQAQIGGSPGYSNVAAAVADGAGIVNVFTVGNTGLEAVMVMDDSPIEEPADLEGATIGYKGAPHAAYVAMLANEDVDRSAISEVSVGYDPRILADGELDALMVWVSNEPLTMERAGYEVRLLEASDYGVSLTFGQMTANEDWAAEHPTALADFLRASLRGFEWAADDPEGAVEIAAGMSDVDYDAEAELARLEAEAELVHSTAPEDHGIGWQNPELVAAELEIGQQAGIVEEAPDPETVIDNSYVESIYDGTTLVWPEGSSG